MFDFHTSINVRVARGETPRRSVSGFPLKVAGCGGCGRAALGDKLEGGASGRPPGAAALFPAEAPLHRSPLIVPAHLLEHSWSAFSNSLQSRLKFACKTRTGYWF